MGRERAVNPLHPLAPPPPPPPPDLVALFQQKPEPGGGKRDNRAQEKRLKNRWTELGAPGHAMLIRDFFFPFFPLKRTKTR